jgi:hypothetical protein
VNPQNYVLFLHSPLEEEEVIAHLLDLLNLSLRLNLLFLIVMRCLTIQRHKLKIERRIFSQTLCRRKAEWLSLNGGGVTQYLGVRHIKGKLYKCQLRSEVSNE